MSAHGAKAATEATAPASHPQTTWRVAHFTPTPAAPLVGARLVRPGPHLDGDSVYHMIEAHGVTVSAGVPTVWANLLAHVEQHRLRFTKLRSVVIGGAAAPASQIAAFEE